MYFYPMYVLKFNVLVFLIIHAPLKNLNFSFAKTKVLYLALLPEIIISKEMENIQNHISGNLPSLSFLNN